MTTPDYREQARAAVEKAIDDLIDEAAGMMDENSDSDVTGAKSRLHAALASWASRIAEEERAACVKIAEDEAENCSVKAGEARKRRNEVSAFGWQVSATTSLLIAETIEERGARVSGGEER